MLPFPRDGYGQDDEWVMANFTNATEILAVGYPQWVDAQVGEGLTNGLYKLTVTVPDDPPETTLLTVGDLSVAVTNAGDYVFLLEKGVGYSLSVFPATATNFSYAAVDDIPSGLSFQSLPDSPSGEWTVDRGRLEIVPPVYPMTLYTPRSRAMWTPCLSVSPSTWQPSALDDTETFTAVLSDIPPFVSVSYRWNTSDPGVVSVASPNSKSTSMTYVPPSGEAGFPSLSLLVGVDEASLRSYFSHDWGGAGGNAVSFTVSAPEVLFVNDDDDNGDGEEDFFAPGLRDDDVASGSILLHSQDSVSGVVTVDGIYGYGGGNTFQSLLFADKECTDEITVGRSFAVTQETEWSKAIYFNPATASTSYPGVQVKARWHPSEGPDLTASAFATIVSPRAEPVCNATTNVVEGGEAYEYTVNPCGVGIGRVGHFRVEVAPDSFPDDKIVWEKTDGLEFAGSCTGRCVSVRGVTEGVATLAVKVGDCRSDAPTFDVEVVQNVTVNLRAWIITGRLGEKPVKPEDVRRMVKDANDIYAQVGVTLNLIEPIVVTDILPRMLMSGRRKDSDNQIDITSGDIYGVYHTYDENHKKVWHKDDAPTAFPFGYKNITHQ